MNRGVSLSLSKFTKYYIYTTIQKQKVVVIILLFCYYHKAFPRKIQPFASIEPTISNRISRILRIQTVSRRLGHDTIYKILIFKLNLTEQFVKTVKKSYRYYFRGSRNLTNDQIVYLFYNSLLADEQANKQIETFIKYLQPKEYYFTNIECKVHRESNSYGMPLSYISKCECCAKLAEKQSLNINFPLIKIYYSGAQVPSYLTILKYLILLFLIISIINALPMTLINHKGKCCEKKIKCSNSNIIHFSIFNIFDQHKKIKLEAYITFVSYLVCLIFWQILISSLRKIKKEIDQCLLFPSPFAIFCELPDKKIDKSMFLNALENWWKLQLKHNKQKLSVAFPQFYLEAPKLSNFNQFKKKYKQTKQSSSIIQRLSSELIENMCFSYNQDELRQHQININQLTQKMQNQRSRFSFSKFRQQLLKKRDQLEKQVRRNNFCLVVFKKIKYAQYFLSRTVFNTLQKFICLENIRPFILDKEAIPVEGNLYPNEIYWKNHHFSDDQKKAHLLKIIAIFILLLVGGTGLTFLSCFIHNKEQDNHQTRYIFLFAGGIIVNLYLIISTHFIGKCAQSYQLSTYSRVKMTKILFVSLFNIILLFILPFCIFHTVDINYLWDDSGLLENLTITFIVFMIFSLLKRYLAPSQFLNFNKKRNLEKGDIKFNQKQANQISAKTPHHIDEQYISILTVICTDLFLSPFCPYITIFSSVWFILHYFLERINIAFFYRQDEYHSSILSETVSQYIQKCFSFIIFGNMATYVLSVHYFTEKVSVQIVFFYIFFGLIIIITYLFPTTKLISRFEKKKIQQQDEKLYKQSTKNMSSLYQHYNPSLFLNILASEQNLQEVLHTTDEIHTIQASLTISLKQRLLMNKQAIPKNGDNMTESDDVYFEYEKKVIMKKYVPKVFIPPLFKDIKDIKMNEVNIGKCIFARRGSQLETE